MDNPRGGPLYLGRPEIATIVMERLQSIDGEGGLGSLHAFVVMPNHVHMLCAPAVALQELMRRIKGSTARQANQLLGLAGEPFWQGEYFDRMVRNDSEFDRIRHYIEWNPVKAGIARCPEDFRWSSAYGGELVRLKPHAG